MATTDKDPMEGLERRRAQLEDSVSKLRLSLQHWQTWEWEYEMFKEEIQSAQSPTPSQMTEIGRSLSASLLNEKEIQDLVGKDRAPRTANQVIDLISKRVDYVQQNISTISKQLDAAEKKLAGATVLLEPDLENEEGLPLMDIQEELDEDGNVISSSVSQPGKSAPEIVEALRKVGLKGVDRGEADGSDGRKGEASRSSVSATPTTGKTTAKTPSTTGSDGPKPTDAQTTSSNSSKKSVSFSEDTKPEPTTQKSSGLQATGYNEALADYNFTSGTKVIEVDEYDNEIASYPIIPQGESPEDAALRRQMLQYGLSEVGQVVAEIDLDGRDDGSEEEDDDYDDDHDDDDDEASEVEDEFGRSLRREVPDDYHRQMLELEKMLNARMVENVGPHLGDNPIVQYADDVRTLKVRKDDEFGAVKDISGSGPPDLPPKKKGVRFADGLDISDPPPPHKPDKPDITNPPPSLAPRPTMSDTIVERTGPAPEPPSMNPTKSTKVSRFKSARTPSAQPVISILPNPPVPEPQPIPEGPKGRILASTIVDHDAQLTEPQVPDEFDPAVIQREVETQYHIMRNKMIQQRGGFKSTAEEEDYPLMEEKDGQTKKVSRFRAARLKADGL